MEQLLRARRRVGVQGVDRLPPARGLLGKHEVQVVPYGTDASTLALAGIPAVVFGPGDIARAHTCDEWVPVEEVAQASERFTNGVAGNIEVITAQSSLLRARDTEIDARFTLAAARVALARAAGIARQLY